MKHQVQLTAASLAVAALLGACSSGQDIGKACTFKGEKNCVDLGANGSPPPSKSATPKATRTTSRPSVTPKTSSPPPQQTACYKPHAYTIVIRDQYRRYEPDTKRVYQTDFIKFTNLDKTHVHSWTSKTGEWDSGELKAGQSYTYQVNLKPGKYNWKDTAVPYIDGGPLEVLKRPC